jgi:hypothetical protein
LILVYGNRAFGRFEGLTCASPPRRETMSSIVSGHADASIFREGSLMDPNPGPPSAPPPPSGPGIAPAPSSGVAEVFIPYKNGPALTAYYLGIFSLVCGAFLGIPALILGLKGLKIAKERPEARGGAHAWTGVILGSLMTLVSLAVVAFIAIAMASRR